MSSTAKLEWWVDSREYELFREFVEEKHGVVGLCFPSEVVQAMRAFIDKDRAAAVEDELDTLEDVLADSLGDYSRRRTSSDPLTKDDLGGEDTIKIRCEVPAELKEEFSIYVDEHSEWGYGEALGRAMNAYRDGGREQRLADRLEEMTAAVESSDVDAQDTAQSSESESESKPYRKEEKLEAILSDLADENNMESAHDIEAVPKPHIVDLIHEYCARGGPEASDRTVSNYLGEITDTLGLVEHSNGVLLVKDDEIDGPAFERKDFDALTTEERVEAVHVKLVERAASRGRAQVTAAEIRDEFFNGEPSDSVAHDLRNRAAKADGFDTRTSRSGEKALRVHTSEVTDDTIRTAAGLEARSEIEAGAEETMDAIDQAERGQQRQQRARTDGGTEQVD